MRVAVLEDDLPLCRQLEQMVTDSGHFCHTFASSRALITSLRRDSYDLLLLDWNLPDMSGLELLDWAQANLSPCPPVIMVTSRTDDADVVVALQAGADDYVIKPFDLEELTARIHALLRRQAGRADPAIHYGTLRVDPVTHEVLREGRPVALSARDFALLQAFLDRPGVVMSVPQLEEKMYGWQDEVGSNTVEVYIHALRKKLGADVIRNVRGVGYMAPRLP